MTRSAILRLLCAALGFLLLGSPVYVESQSFEMPGTQPTTSGFPASAKIQHEFLPPQGAVPYGLPCINCHASGSARPLDSWQGSMMSQAARDPLFYAQLDLTNHDGRAGGPRPAVAGMADMCLRCHSAKGWLEGRSSVLTGLGFESRDLFGVQCSVCHRIVDPNTPAAHPDVTNILNGLLPNPGIPPTYGNGMYVMDPKHTRRGPFAKAQIPAHASDAVGEGLDWTSVTTMTFHPAFNSAFHRTGNLCGTCHDVSNPIDPLPGFQGKDTQKCFPIERTWTEWRHSAFFARGEAGNCQSCHMSGPLNSVGFGDPCEGASLLGHLNDIHFHDLTGGNDFIPRVIKDMKQRFDAACTPGDTACSNFKLAVQALYPPSGGNLFADVSIPALDAGRDRVARTLKRAAYLDVTSVSPQLAVRVTNRTGHKLPTGYPEGRRMWLNVKFLGSTGSLIAESGRYEAANGALFHDQNLDGAAGLKLYDVVQYTDAAGTTTGSGRPTKVWEGRMHHAPTSTEFHFALNDELVMDNRIPPEGWNKTEYDNNRALPVIPAIYTTNGWQTDYGAGGGPTVSQDEFSYPLPAGVDRVEMVLNYQTASREYIEALQADNPNTLTGGGFNRGSLLFDAWQRVGRSAPVTMARQVRAILDSDGDGLSNGWEDAFLLTGAADGGRNDDPDGDGLSNWQEFQQGSNPRDGNSPTVGGVRTPVDIALVIDLSGSMNDPAPGTTVPKIQIMKNAVTLFLETWKDYAVPNDRIGVVYFDTNAQQYGSAPLLKSFVSEWSNIRTDVQSKAASGWTAMGAGLYTALQGLTDPARRRHVILFSNGMQNRSPMIVPDMFGDLVIRDQTAAVNPDVTGGSNVTIGASDFALPMGVHIHSIGIGVAENSGGTSWHQLLRDLASQPGREGKHDFITRAFELEGTFLEDLTTALRTNTLEYVLNADRTLSGSAEQVLEIPVNRTARRFSAVVSWSGQTSPPPSFALERPDGRIEDAAPLTRTGPFYAIVTRYLDRIDEAPGDYGVWKLHAKLSGGGRGKDPVRGENIAVNQLRIRVHAVIDDSDLKYQFLVPGKGFRIGEPLRVIAVATEGTQLLKKMDRITVALRSPGTWVGAALARSSHQLNNPAAVDPDLAATPFGRKLLAAYSDKSWVARLGGEETQYTLSDDGRQGDDAAGDGVFSRNLITPSVPGHYRLTFRMEGYTSDGRRFVRQETRSIFVQVGKIDPQGSRIRRISSRGQDYVVLRPRDGRGTLLGPGYTSQLLVRAKNSFLPVEDLLDGSYRVPLPSGFAPGDPVQIGFDGQTVHNAPVRAQTFFEGVPWWVWLLLLILVALALVIWLRR